MEKVKVLIVDDHIVFCEALSSLLAIKGEVDVVGIASNAEDAFKKVKQLNPDVVLMDIELKDSDGIQTTRIIKEKYPNTEVIILTMHTDEQYVLEAIQAGAKGYILKDFPSSLLLEAIRYVAKGKSLFDPTSSSKVLNELRILLNKKRQLTGEKDSSLSKREVEILKLIAEGYTNKEIAQKLHLSQHTVRNHITNIFLKLNCNTRAKAVLEAFKKKLI